MADEFDEVVEEVLASLEPEARQALDNIEIMIDPERPDYMPPGALAVFNGIPITFPHRLRLPVPNQIVLFEGPIRRYAAHGFDVRVVIQEAILHELGHYFGLTHAEMGDKVQA